MVGAPPSLAWGEVMIRGWVESNEIAQRLDDDGHVWVQMHRTNGPDGPTFASYFRAPELEEAEPGQLVTTSRDPLQALMHADRCLVRWLDEAVCKGPGSSPAAPFVWRELPFLNASNPQRLALTLQSAFGPGREVGRVLALQGGWSWELMDKQQRPPLAKGKRETKESAQLELEIRALSMIYGTRPDLMISPWGEDVLAQYETWVCYSTHPLHDRRRALVEELPGDRPKDRQYRWEIFSLVGGTWSTGYASSIEEGKKAADRALWNYTTEPPPDWRNPAVEQRQELEQALAKLTQALG